MAFCTNFSEQYCLRHRPEKFMVRVDFNLNAWLNKAIKKYKQRHVEKKRSGVLYGIIRLIRLRKFT